MSIAKEAAEAFRTKERIQGAVSVLTIVILILTTVNFIGVIEFRTTTEDKWMSSDGRWGFPNWQEREYELQITSVGEYGGSIDVIAKKIDGWSFSGTFFIGDTILLENYRVVLAEKLGSRKPDPLPILFAHRYKTAPCDASNSFDNCDSVCVVAEREIGF